MSPASIEFRSVAPGRISDHVRLNLIHKELRAMSKRQAKMHQMDCDYDLEECINDLISRIDEYQDYDPTPRYLYDDTGGEPAVSAEEVHSGAWLQHQQLHS